MEEAKLQRLDCYLAMKEEEDNFASLEGAFCGRLEMELVGWIAPVFRVIHKGATYTVVKLNQRERWVRHMEWEGRKGKQSPDGNVSEFPVR
jgi:hypothetical protein